MAKNNALTPQQIVDWAQGQEIPDISELMGLTADLDIPRGLKKVLVVESLPCSLALTQGKRAEIAAMTPRMYYNWLHDKRFAEYTLVVSARVLGKSIPRILSAFVRDAELGNSTNQIRALEQVALLKDSNKKRIEFDDVSKPKFDPALSKEVAAALDEAVESGDADDDEQ